MYIEMFLKKLEKDIEKMQSSDKMCDTQKLADCIGLYGEIYEAKLLWNDKQ